MRAAGYCRVSSTEQIDGTSLHVQEQQIRAYCSLKGIELAHLFLDAGISGGIPIAERPQGSQLLDAVHSGEIQAVVIVKLDRAFRNTVDCLQSVDAWEKADVALHIVDLGGNAIDTTSPSGRFMLTILSAAAEMERGMIRDRCNSGRRARKAEGKLVGELPYGFDLAEDGKTLVDNAEEQATLTLIRDLRSQGYSLRRIADELNGRHVPTKKGKAKWNHGSVQSILKTAA
jgi:site-specific DNA recombinase